MTDPESQKQQVPSRLLYHWIKSGLFRVVHADGAYGGISARGYLHFAIYNERAAIPRLSERDVIVNEDGGLVAGPERTTEIRDGMVREVEVEVMMDYRTALEFLEWFKQKIDIMQRIQEEATANDVVQK